MSTPHGGSPDPKTVRASDTDRDRINRQLTEAYSQGQLDLAEYQERSHRALASRYLGSLDELVTDLNLPVLAEHTAALPVRRHPTVDTPGVKLSIAFMSGLSRAGAWTTAQGHTAIAFMGGIDIDLREANFNADQSSIFAVAFMGGIDVIVPPGVRVRIEGLPMMGGFGGGGPALNPADLPPNAPTVTIRGIAFMGGVSVRRKGYGE